MKPNLLFEAGFIQDANTVMGMLSGNVQRYFAKKRLVPMPTVAQIPVSSKTVLVSVFAKVTASM